MSSLIEVMTTWNINGTQQKSVLGTNDPVLAEEEKSRNGDTLGPVELNVGLEQGNQGDQGDRHEQDDQGEVSIIKFGTSE